MAGTSLPPRRRLVWSVTRQRSRWSLPPRPSPTVMIRVRTAIRHTRFPRRAHSSAHRVTRQSGSWGRTRPRSTVTAAVVMNRTRCEQRETELAKAATTTCLRPIMRKTRGTVSGATIRIPSGERRSLLNAHNATRKLGRRPRFTRARFRVLPATNLTDST